jgi:hypothetical protein
MKLPEARCFSLNAPLNAILSDGRSASACEGSLPSSRQILQRESLKCSPLSPTQCRSNPVSSRSLSKTGVFQMSAGDYRQFRSENGQTRSPETHWKFAKARHWRAIMRGPGTYSPAATLPGWRRSADRTRLRANSLLTGNFTGKIAIPRLLQPIPEQETAVLQSLFAQFPKQLNRENIAGNRQFLSANREFQSPFFAHLFLRVSDAIRSQTSLPT